jgi:hypothetical protein
LMTPDLPRPLDRASARGLWRRPSFRVGARVFHKIPNSDDAYFDGHITVFHDQQDSTAWAARKGAVRTGYYWAPEYAVEKLLESLCG